MSAVICPKAHPVATAPGSVFVNRKFKILPSFIHNDQILKSRIVA